MELSTELREILLSHSPCRKFYIYLPYSSTCVLIDLGFQQNEKVEVVAALFEHCETSSRWQLQHSWSKQCSSRAPVTSHIGTFLSPDCGNSVDISAGTERTLEDTHQHLAQLGNFLQSAGLATKIGQFHESSSIRYNFVFL